MTDVAELDAKMSDDDVSTLRDHIMALEHTNGSPLIHDADRADRFTDPTLKTHRFMVFEENKAEAETRMAMLASQVSHDTKKLGDHWFTQEALDKV